VTAFKNEPDKTFFQRVKKATGGIPYTKIPTGLAQDFIEGKVVCRRGKEYVVALDAQNLPFRRVFID
jgi:hypothetical protein